MTDLDQILMDYLVEEERPTQPRLQIAEVLAGEMVKRDLTDARRISKIVQRLSSSQLRAVRPRVA